MSAFGGLDLDENDNYLEYNAQIYPQILVNRLYTPIVYDWGLYTVQTDALLFEMLMRR